jgi:5-oxoprolinase (ATP-hydrolysing)
MRPLTAAILSERRTVAPFGIAGGSPAKRGLNLVVKKDGHTINIGAKSVVKLQVRLLIGSARM